MSRSRCNRFTNTLSNRISRHFIQDIFKPFTQVDRSTTRNFDGTGLRLSITRRLRDYLGGSVSVVSQVGIGSRFEVELPLAKKQRHERIVKLQKSAMQFGKELPKIDQSKVSLKDSHILFVDALGENRVVVERILTRSHE